tara:strand:- start:1674 stop:1856 length:183 start_codon:yes stop_codon:yes gene_type:complete
MNTQYVVIETSEYLEGGMRVLFIGNEKAEVKAYLQAMKNLAKPTGQWNPSAIKVLPYESE